VSLDADSLFLRRAVELAEQGLYSTTPNPRVGCVIVRDGRVIGRGAHLRAGEPHAEVNAIADAGGAVAGATVYVSLEPCTVTGQTPPCVDALIAGRVARVVAAQQDRDPRVDGRGLEALRSAGIAVALRPMAEAAALNEGFTLRQTRGRPLLRLKVAASLDGRVALASGESQWITGPAARADVQRWRARSCAVLSGSGRVRADDPRLTVREPACALAGRLRQPLRVVVDSRLRTPADAALVRAEGPVLLAHGPGAAAPAYPSKVSLLELPAGEQGLALPALLDALGARGMNEVLVEAGPRLSGALLRAGLVDELLLYSAPKLLGDGARSLAELAVPRLADATPWRLVDCCELGGDLRLRLRP